MKKYKRTKWFSRGDYVLVIKGAWTGETGLVLFHDDGGVRVRHSEEMYLDYSESSVTLLGRTQ